MDKTSRKISEQDRLAAVSAALACVSSNSVNRPTVDFVENKKPDAARIAQFLATSEAANHWANGGPVFCALRESYRQFFKLPESRDLLPCANGGIALELLARIHEHKYHRRLRWVASAFSFCNVGRGYFADTKLIDCNQYGMLDLELLEKESDDSYDGFVVTNIFGLWKDFDPYIKFASQRNKVLLIDNAGGVGDNVPDYDYQVFSLHQTKPFGAGEGGLAFIPASESELATELLNYKTLRTDPSIWLNNGKLSDISCAYLLDRLERYPEWGPLYQYQASRVVQFAESAGLKKLFPYQNNSIATSLPFLAPRPVDLQQLDNRGVTLGKFYKPLSALTNTQSVYERIVNIPSHADVSKLAQSELVRILNNIVALAK